MDLQQQEQFYQMMGRLRGSRAASVPTKVTRVTEKINGLLVSKPVKEPEIIDLQEYTKTKSNAASAPGININKLREIHNFITSRRY
jgi:hypothetical protein